MKKDLLLMLMISFVSGILLHYILQNMNIIEGDESEDPSNSDQNLQPNDTGDISNTDDTNGNGSVKFGGRFAHHKSMGKTKSGATTEANDKTKHPLRDPSINCLDSKQIISAMRNKDQYKDLELNAFTQDDWARVFDPNGYNHPWYIQSANDPGGCKSGLLGGAVPNWYSKAEDGTFSSSEAAKNIQKVASEMYSDSGVQNSCSQKLTGTFCRGGRGVGTGRDLATKQYNNILNLKP